MRYTKWVTLLSFNYGQTGYMVFARMHKKTGMLYFKQKRLNYVGGCSRVPKLDPDAQLKILMDSGESND